MAWAFVGVSNVVEVTTTAHALVTTGISGLQAGDLLVACISSRIASTVSVTLPAGWTPVAEQKTNNTATNNSATPSALMAYCVRGASNPALTFTHPVAPSVAIGRIVAYRGLGASLPALGAQTSFTTGTNTTAVSGAGLTTVQNGALIVAMAAGGQEAAWSAFDATDPSTASGATNTATAPTAGTWIERADSITTTGADTSLAIFDAIKSTAGATGNLTTTASVAAAHVVIAGSFKPPLAAVMPADPGVLALDGVDSVLAYARRFSIDPGVIALSGNAVGMRKGYLATTSAGSIALTGQPAAMKVTRRLPASTGPVALSGAAVTLSYGRVMPASAGAIDLTGIDATLIKTAAAAAYVLPAETGAIVLSGQDANLVHGQPAAVHYTLTAAPGAIVLAGGSVLLTVTAPAAAPYYPVSMASLRNHRFVRPYRW